VSELAVSYLEEETALVASSTSTARTDSDWIELHSYLFIGLLEVATATFE
jgi:hypothetical protein